MTELCIDTSGATAVSIVRDGQVIGASRNESGHHHAESITPCVLEALEDAGLPPDVSRAGLDAVCVGTGPAPFTGLRAGLVSARVFAKAAGIPVYGVCSLDAIARLALDHLSPDTHVYALTDARRKELYWGHFVAEGPDDVRLIGQLEVGFARALGGALREQSGLLVSDAPTRSRGNGSYCSRSLGSRGGRAFRNRTPLPASSRYSRPGPGAHVTSLESIARERAEASGGQLLVLGIEARQALVTLEQEIFPEDPWTTGMIAQELSSGRSVYFGVCVNDDAVAPPVLCGYAGIALGIDADVMTMGVLPDFRGRGLGRVLMDALIDVARRWGSERVFLEVRESNAAAISLYENSGFEVVGRTKGYFRNPREDALNMRLIVR